MYAAASGLNTISIYSQKIDVTNGDILVCVLNNRIEMIQSHNSISNFLFRSNLKLGDKITIDNSLESATIVPALSLVFVQPLELNLPVLTPEDVGYLDVFVEFSDWTNEVQEISRRFIIQV